MSVCTFIASKYPLKEVAPEKEYPIAINLDNGTIDDGGADDNYFLFQFNDVSDYTDMKYGVYLEWDYTDGRAEQILNYMRAALEEAEQIEFWHVWLGDYYEYEDSPVIHKRTIRKMKEFDLFGFQVEIDKAATKEWYDKANEWGCECGDCRHFVTLAKKKELPSAVIEILEQFGIAPQKATYVCRMDIEEHEILYQFSYRVAGNIIKDRDGGGANDFDWGAGYCVHEPYPYGAPKFPTPHFDLEFWVRLPREHKYSDLADLLMHGREIEFVYKNRECAITNYTNRWWFHDGVDQVEVCEFSNFEVLVNKVAEYMVEDKTVQEIFDAGLYRNLLIL